MRPIGGFDYVVFVIGPFGFIIGMIVVSQVAGGIILFADRKRKRKTNL